MSPTSQCPWTLPCICVNKNKASCNSNLENNLSKHFAKEDINEMDSRYLVNDQNAGKPSANLPYFLISL
jgi:hypothetical protein